MNQTSCSTSLPKVLFQEENLPSIPTVALEILRLSKDPTVSVEDLGEVISSDPALSAKILKLANSSLYRRGDEITTLPKAAVLLGLKTVKLMALSFSLTRNVERDSADSDSDYDLEEYWRHSLTLGVSARALARRVGSQRDDEAFLCGLLSYIGQMVMAQSLEEYNEVLDHATTMLPTSELEFEILNFNFHQVGGALLTNWGLPSIIALTVSHWGHEDLQEYVGNEQELQLCQIMKVANCASNVICELEKGQALKELHDCSNEFFGLGGEQIEEFLVNLQQDVQETAQLLNLDLSETDDYTSIVEDARSQMVQISLNTALDLEATTNRQRELEKEKQELELKAYTDKLTGIDNRESFEGFLHDTIRGHLTRNRPPYLGLLILDVDHFKKFNDTHGHLVGDDVLKLVSKSLVHCVRETDMAARFGGEEFVVLLPGTKEEALERVAERIRLNIEQTKYVTKEGETLSVTVSLGGVFCDAIYSTEQGEDLIKLADDCLYEAKNAGRNQWLIKKIELEKV